MAMASWKDMITHAREQAKDGTPIVQWASKPNHSPWSDEPEPPVEYGMDAPDGRQWYERRFDNGYGGTDGDWFTVWTEARVYFPGCYDGAEFVGSAPRHPCAEATQHIGGG